MLTHRGATRPLGISNVEDKIVQKMMHKVLESIYEPLFLDCSYGFRPGRGCHDAIRALSEHLYRHEVQTVIDVDLANYFGTLDHRMLLSLVGEKVKDPRFLRYLGRMFKAGVLAEGELQVSDEGVPQGSLCSPILANVVAHYVIDVWFEGTVKPRCRGRAALYRYCDDLVICCQYEDDAVRIHKALRGRLAKYCLKLNEEKTRLVSFSKRAQRKGSRLPLLPGPVYTGDCLGKVTLLQPLDVLQAVCQDTASLRCSMGWPRRRRSLGTTRPRRRIWWVPRPRPWPAGST